MQLASRGMPLLGDRKYGAGEADGCPVALWSHRIGFFHPETGAWMGFSALPPAGAPWTDFPGWHRADQ